MPLIITRQALTALDRAFTHGVNPMRRPKEFAEQVLGPLARWVKNESQFSGGNTKTAKTNIGKMMVGSNQKLDKRIAGQNWEVEGVALVPSRDLAKLAEQTPGEWNLTPAEQEQVAKANFCPGASEGCMAVCLRNSGQMVMKASTQAQIKRTMAYMFNRPAFMAAIVVAIAHFYHTCRKGKRRCAFRLNITSDLDWENKSVDIPEWMAAWLRESYSANWIRAGHYANICEVFNPPGRAEPPVQFYDYTKVERRIKNFAFDKKWPSNYWLTWSLSETNESRKLALWVLQNQITTVTVPFKRKSEIRNRRKAEPLPTTMALRDTATGVEHSFPVLDGDAHDLRFIDRYAMDALGTGAWVGLHFKTPNNKEMAGRGSQGKADASKGFIVDQPGSHVVLPVSV